MKVLSSKALCFEKFLIYQKATEKQNMGTLYSREACKYRAKYSSSKKSSKYFNI